jgi:hypothetical protein
LEAVESQRHVFAHRPDAGEVAICGDGVGLCIVAASLPRKGLQGNPHHLPQTRARTSPKTPLDRLLGSAQPALAVPRGKQAPFYIKDCQIMGMETLLHEN